LTINIISLTKLSVPLIHRISMTSYLFSLRMVTPYVLHTLHHSDQIIFINESHSPLLPTCFTSSLEPASDITQDSSSKLFIPLSATIIWTCRFNLLHTAITFHHFSLFHSELKTYIFRKAYPPP